MDEMCEPFVRLAIQNRKIIRWLAATIILFSFALFFHSAFQKYSGKSAWLLLLIILFLAPAAEITRSKTLHSLMFFRREAGIMMGMFAIGHILAFFQKNGIGIGFILERNFWLSENGITPIGWGMAALLTTILLLATSNNFSVRLLKRNWKKLHRLAYVIFLLVALHIAFIKYDFFKSVFIVFSYIVLKIIASSGLKLPETTAKKETEPE